MKKLAASRLLLKPGAVVRYLRDRRAPILPKLLLLAAAVYVVLPVDLVPDVVPILGWLDDVGLLALAIAWLGRAVDRHEKVLESTTLLGVPTNPRLSTNG